MPKPSGLRRYYSTPQRDPASKRGLRPSGRVTAGYLPKNKNRRGIDTQFMTPKPPANQGRTHQHCRGPKGTALDAAKLFPRRERLHPDDLQRASAAQSQIKGHRRTEKRLAESLNDPCSHSELVRERELPIRRAAIISTLPVIRRLAIDSALMLNQGAAYYLYDDVRRLSPGDYRRAEVTSRAGLFGAEGSRSLAGEPEAQAASCQSPSLPSGAFAREVSTNYPTTA